MVADAGPPLVLMAIGLSTSTSQGDGSPITF